MGRLLTNPMFQLTVVSIALMAVLATAVSVALTGRLDRKVELVNEYDDALASGIAVLPEEPFSVESLRGELSSLRNLTYAAVGGGFAILNGGLILVIWLAWGGMGRQNAGPEPAKVGLEDGYPGGTSALREDNEGLRRALVELKETQQQVAQQARMRALGQLAGGIAHDFNKALSPITAYSELLLIAPDSLDDKERVTSYLKAIHASAQDAAAAVRRLREFYRESDHAELVPGVALNDVVRDAVSLTRPRWTDQTAGATIDVETDLQDIPPIVGNESGMQEALASLMLNAVDAMPDGGTITIATRAKDNDVVLEFSDTGTGMTEEVRQRSMDPFFSTKGDGAKGMGLAMVFGIVERHRGTIDVESEPGRGTTFTLSLPVDTTAPAGAERDTVELPQARALRILAVDDDPKGLRVLTECLTIDGHAVDTAANGREAMKKFQPTKYDVVVTDRAMPEMNGDQLASAVKKAAPDQPVIMVTGFGDIMAASGDSPPGVDLVLAKPVTLSAMREALAKVSAAGVTGSPKEKR